MQEDNNNGDSSGNEVDEPVRRPDPDEIEKGGDSEGKNKKARPKPEVVECEEDFNTPKKSKEN